MSLVGCAGADGIDADEHVAIDESAVGTKVVAKTGPVNPSKTYRPFGLQHGPIIPYEWWIANTVARGTQPTTANIAYLADHGFRGVVNLRSEDNTEEQSVLDAGMNYLHLPIVDGTVPTDAQMKRFLKFATNPKNTPLYVHCNAGRNRTGVAVAIYEMAVMGMTAKAAIKEGETFGLHLATQETYIEDFETSLHAGKIPGYPVK